MAVKLKLNNQEKRLLSLAVFTYALFLFFTCYFYRAILAPSLTETIAYFPLQFVIEAILLTVFLGSSIVFTFLVKPRWIKGSGILLVLLALFLWSWQVLGFVSFGLSHSFSLSAYQNEVGYQILKRVASPDRQKEAIAIVESGSSILGPHYYVEIEYKNHHRPVKRLLILSDSCLGFWNSMQWKDNDTIVVIDKPFSINQKSMVFDPEDLGFSHWNP